MSLFENVVFFSSFLFVSMVMYTYGRIDEKFKMKARYAIIPGVLLGVLVTIANIATSGAIAPQSMLSDSKTYTVVGAPIKSSTNDGEHIIVLRASGSIEHAYYIKNLPPKGYKSLKTEAGQTLYVPEKYILSK